MSRERPIELFWRYWTVPKGGSTDEQNEDACSVRRLDLGDSAPGLLVAVSDGATEAVYSRAWARALVAAVEPDWPTLSDAYLDERLARVGRAFSPIEPGQQVPWYVRNKLLSQGSQATLLAAVLAGSDGSDSFVVSAVAIGDSCLLIFRTDGDVAAFPIQLARDFGLNPDLVRNRFATPVRADRWQGKLAPGDVLLACTDAVGRWVLQCLESGQADLALRAVLDLLTLAHEDSLSQGEQLTGLQLERALAETLEPRAGEAACAPSSGEPPSVEPPDASPAENHLASDPLPATPSSREGVPPGAVVRRGSIVPDGLRRLAERIGLCPGLPRSADDEPSSAALDAERPDPHSDSTPAADPPSQLEAEGRGIGTTSLEKGPQPGSLPENDGTRSTLSRLPGSQAAEPAPIVPAAVPMPDSGASSPVSSGTAGQSAFADLVRRQRDPDSPVRMRNDDSTLVVCIPVRGAGDQGFREALTVIRKHVATARAQRPVAGGEGRESAHP